MKTLVIVESPAKAKTIEGYLGRGYQVEASFGHVRDLPKSKLGVDVEKDFEPEYIIPKKVTKAVNQLKKDIAAANKVYLATDLDREGEAIAWHIRELSGEPDSKFTRITFSEITKAAILKSIKEPRDINNHLVDAQKTRRILDRLVGYKLSPILWKKVRSGLSAGRVQSVAVKLIVDREDEIDQFKAEEYWSLDAYLKARNGDFAAALSKKDGKKIVPGSKKEVERIIAELKNKEYTVSDISSKDTMRHPAAPFITSTLQQEAARKLGYSAKKTMMIAQQLYEGVRMGSGSHGLITYMRTDSYNLAPQAIRQAKEVIKKTFGPRYLHASVRLFKKKSKGAQEAHEAIRPTDLSFDPEKVKRYLNRDQIRLYELIWKRTLATQMAPAEITSTGIDISAGTYTFRATGTRIRFDGFMALYLEGSDDETTEENRILPQAEKGEKLKLAKLEPQQHFTQPPPRYTEASLIKALEERGIGRPSTYAPTISTILSRGYVELESKRLKPEPIAKIVTQLLAEHFDFVVDEDFTVKLEDELDEIAAGRTDWLAVVKGFYQPLEDKKLEEKMNTIGHVKLPEEKTDEKCEACGKDMVVKTGRFGRFLACSGFPECKNTKPLLKKIDMKCPNCGIGEVIERKTKKRRLFYGCSRYPECDFSSWTKPKAPAVSK